MTTRKYKRGDRFRLKTKDSDSKPEFEVLFETPSGLILGFTHAGLSVKGSAFHLPRSGFSRIYDHRPFGK